MSHSLCTSMDHVQITHSHCWNSTCQWITRGFGYAFRVNTATAEMTEWFESFSKHSKVIQTPQSRQSATTVGMLSWCFKRVGPASAPLSVPDSAICCRKMHVSHLFECSSKTPDTPLLINHLRVSSKTCRKSKKGEVERKWLNSVVQHLHAASATRGQPRG